MIGMFDGQLALVTGASRGIGAEIAKTLAAQGAHVILTARTSSDLEQVEETIHTAGGKATIAPLDLTDPESISRLAQAVSGRWGALDILVLNAAMLGTLTGVSTIDGQEFNRVITLNLMAQQAMIANFDVMLRNSKDARVVALTSSVAKSPRAYWGGYAASKAALETLVMSYGEEVRNMAKIRTAIVDPGRTRTKMRAQAYPGEDPQALKTADIVAKEIANLLSSDFETNVRLEIENKA
ncbi:SDR family NAD(P)-dependent oxidoreductase [Sphingorhabdus sp. Alg239-R122]|uniref:SDR family NAD(P)-dependent oxidoreductase n=1 Tax=Sphingorhabdus sp. Alg239-R122 TaxID=2305989 RepID=UPI0013DBDB3D|nr:SDR family NAD(P)-dependent oxidoreductase [Sphingorhabdus sp. Alg239-R122]